MERPRPSSAASLPRAPSISSPTGNPPDVMPANSDRPGRPALLPGSVLRIMVSKVAAVSPPLIDISPDPFAVSISGAGEVGAGDVACDIRQGYAFDALRLQIRGDVGDGFMQLHRKRHLG